MERGTRGARSSGGSGADPQAGGAGEGLPHAHALLVNAQGVGLHGQLVFQSALGHDQQLLRVLRLPQPQLEGLHGVIDGAHLAHEPGERAEGKARFSQPGGTGLPCVRSQVGGARLAEKTEGEQADR